MFLREAYAIGYDRRMRNPAWVVEHLTKQKLKPDGGRNGDDDNHSPDRSHSSFQEDQALPEQFRSKLSDYFRSGYDRGHMAPAADAKRSQKAMDETFILSNISPQVGEGFNRDYWAHLENYVRRLTSSFEDVYVFTIPLYLPRQDPVTKKNFVSYEVIGNPPNVAVPTHFAKVLYLQGGKSDPSSRGSISSFLLPNSKISNSVPLESFLTPIESIEKSTGLNLFNQSVKDTSLKASVCDLVGCELVIRNFDDFNKQNKRKQ
uniref:Endonuclease n=1 Tax=Phakopsora pachyrhizi TaxID=170000 RepID=A0A0S1MJC7_PHAPC